MHDILTWDISKDYIHVYLTTSKDFQRYPKKWPHVSREQSSYSTLILNCIFSLEEETLTIRWGGLPCFPVFLFCSNTSSLLFSLICFACNKIKNNPNNVQPKQYQMTYFNPLNSRYIDHSPHFDGHFDLGVPPSAPQGLDLSNCTMCKPSYPDYKLYPCKGKCMLMLACPLNRKGVFPCAKKHACIGIQCILVKLYLKFPLLNKVVPILNQTIITKHVVHFYSLILTWCLRLAFPTAWRSFLEITLTPTRPA